jgi:uncharacterized membrane protein
MRTREFLNRLDHNRIVATIKEAEAKTSGQIRVYVQRGELAGDPVIEAQKQFHKLGMQATKERNGVLIFVVPRARKFAVLGDEGVHKKCGEIYWQRVVDLMREHFREEKFSAAIVAGIRDIGAALAMHFPKRLRSSDELPDEIVES